MTNPPRPLSEAEIERLFATVSGCQSKTKRPNYAAEEFRHVIASVEVSVIRPPFVFEAQRVYE